MIWMLRSKDFFGYNLVLPTVGYIYDDKCFVSTVFSNPLVCGHIVALHAINSYYVIPLVQTNT